MYTTSQEADCAGYGASPYGGDGPRAHATPEDGLLEAARSGDRTARQRLYARCLPELQRWARGRLHGYTRDINDADDLVQIALLRTLNRLDEIENRGYASFLAYLRQILLNEVRGELRKQRHRGETVEYTDTLAMDGDPVFEQMVAHQRERAYCNAVRRLNRHQREHICLRLELGMSFGEIARRVGGSSDGARMTVARALRSLNEYLAPAVA